MREPLLQAAHFTPYRWLRMMQGKTIKPDPFKRMDGSDVTVEWLETDPFALREPIVVETSDGLGLEMPKDITVAEIAETLGENTPVEVIGELPFITTSRGDSC